ncbi:MAG: tetratricopeptide repeat protein [Anaerolineae bacterium]|nr:tetratricopeptide repeat protein [Anaerolineae bacterium]
MRNLTALILCLVAGLLALPALAQTDPAQPSGSDSGSVNPISLLTAPGLIDLASADLQAERYDRAVIGYSLYILLNPTYGPAYYGRAAAYAGLEDETNYAANLDQALRYPAVSPNFAAAVYLSRVGIYIQHNDAQGALNELNTGIQAVPDSPDLYIIRARLYAANQQYQKAVDDYTQAITLAPDEPMIYGERGDVYQEMQNWDAALADYNHYIQLAPDDATGYAGRGRVNAQQQDYQAALDDYNQAEKLDPTYTQVYIERGFVYRALSNPDSALADYNHYIELMPDDAEGYFQRANLHISTGDNAKAVDDLTSAIRIQPDASVLYLLRGFANTALGNDADGASDYYAWIDRNSRASHDEAALVSGQRITVTMELGAVFSVPFAATAGQKISVLAATTDGNSDPLLVLLDPDGHPVIANDDVSNTDLSALILRYVAPTSGTYTAVVGHARGGWTGPVLIELRLED